MNVFDLEPTTLGSKGIKPPVSFAHRLPFRRGLNPLLNGTKQPSALCLLPSSTAQKAWD